MSQQIESITSDRQPRGVESNSISKTKARRHQPPRGECALSFSLHLLCSSQSVARLPTPARTCSRQEAEEPVGPFENVPADPICIQDIWGTAVYNLTEFPALDGYLRSLAAFAIYRALGFPQALPLAMNATNATLAFNNISVYDEMYIIAGDLCRRILVLCANANDETESTANPSHRRFLAARQAASTPPTFISRGEAETNAAHVWENRIPYATVGEVWDSSGKQIPDDAPGPVIGDTPRLAEHESGQVPWNEEGVRGAKQGLAAGNDGTLPPEALDEGSRAGQAIFFASLANVVGISLGALAITMDARRNPVKLVRDGLAVGLVADKTTDQISDYLLKLPYDAENSDCDEAWNVDTLCAELRDTDQYQACVLDVQRRHLDCLDLAVIHASQRQYWADATDGAFDLGKGFKGIKGVYKDLVRQIDTGATFVRRGYRYVRPRFARSLLNVYEKGKDLVKGTIKAVESLDDAFPNTEDPFRAAAQDWASRNKVDATCESIPDTETGNRPGPDAPLCYQAIDPTFSIVLYPYMNKYPGSWAGLDFLPCMRLVCSQCSGDPDRKASSTWMDQDCKIVGRTICELC